MGEDDTSLESLPRMQFHLLEPLRVDDQVCGRCGGPPQAHPTPQALAEWEAAQAGAPMAVAPIRRRLWVLDVQMAHYAKLHPSDQANVLRDVFDAVKTMPRLLDEIERLQAALAAGPVEPGAGED